MWNSHPFEKEFNIVTFNIIIFTNKLKIGVEVLRAVVMKSTIFWDITPCFPSKVNRRFGGTYLIHRQD
jgi:hypothetical protein